MCSISTILVQVVVSFLTSTTNYVNCLLIKEHRKSSGISINIVAKLGKDAFENILGTKLRHRDIVEVANIKEGQLQ